MGRLLTWWGVACGCAISWQGASHSGNCEMNWICSTQRFSRASSRGPEPQSRWSSPKACWYTAARSTGSIRPMARRSAPVLQKNAMARAATKRAARTRQAICRLVRVDAGKLDPVVVMLPGRAVVVPSMAA